jgi:hypothetical protein
MPIAEEDGQIDVQSRRLTTLKAPADTLTDHSLVQRNVHPIAAGYRSMRVE